MLENGVRGACESIGVSVCFVRLMCSTVLHNIFKTQNHPRAGLLWAGAGGWAHARSHYAAGVSCQIVVFVEQLDYRACCLLSCRLVRFSRCQLVFSNLSLYSTCTCTAMPASYRLSTVS